MKNLTMAIMFAALLGAAASFTSHAADEPWAIHAIEQFGGTILYPQTVFEPVPRDTDEADQVFVATDDEARLAVGSWLNEGAFSPQELKNNLLRDAREASLTYEPGGRTWFVLSGYEGDDIYYQKVMFSCGGNVVTAFGLTYPTAGRARYDPIVERMEDNFRPGRRCP